MLYSKILVAFDGSELGNKALETAIALAAGNHEIELNVVHALEYHPVVTEYTTYSIVDDMELINKAGEKIIKTAQDRLSSIPNRSNTMMVEGRADQVIIDQAKKLQSDLIVIGSRGLSGIKELFLGSVSHYICQHAHIPVLVVK